MILQVLMMMILIQGSSSAFIRKLQPKRENSTSLLTNHENKAEVIKSNESFMVKEVLPTSADKEDLIHPVNNEPQILKNTNVNSDLLSYDDFSIVDMLEIGEKELALHHLDEDIGEFEGLKRRIVTLEGHLRKHADRSIVDNKEIIDSDKILKEMDAKEIKPFEDALISIKNRIKLSNNKFDDKSLKNIMTLVERAEKFLDAGQAEVQEMEMVEYEWKGLEKGQISKDTSVNNDILSYDDFPIVDMLEIGEKELALHHLNEDIGEFEGLKRRIGNLEGHLRKHADINIVDNKEIIDSDKILKEMNSKEIKPFEDALIAIKNQIKLSNNKFDKKSLKDIITLVERAEKFLDAGQEEVQEMEKIEHEWQGLEKGQLIQDEIYKGLMKEKFESGIALNSKLKTKLMEGENVKSKLGHPIRKSGERMIKLNKPSLLETKDKKYMRKGLSDIEGKFNSSKLMERMKAHAIKEIKQKLNEEAFNDQKVGPNKDPVVGFLRQDVQKAFDEAAESSHKFIDKTLHHRLESQMDDNMSDRPHSISRYLAIGLGVLALLVLCPSVYIFLKTMKYGWRTNLDKSENTSSPCKQLYLELNEVKEVAGWINPFRSPSNTGKMENKLK